MKFSIKHFLSECIPADLVPFTEWSHFLKKSLTKIFIFGAVNSLPSRLRIVQTAKVQTNYILNKLVLRDIP